LAKLEKQLKNDKTDDYKINQADNTLPDIDSKGGLQQSYSKSQAGHRSLSNHPSSQKSGGTLNNLIYSPNPPISKKILDKSYNSTQGSNLKYHLQSR